MGVLSTRLMGKCTWFYLLLLFMVSSSFSTCPCSCSDVMFPMTTTLLSLITAIVGTGVVTVRMTFSCQLLSHGGLTIVGFRHVILLGDELVRFFVFLDH